ncbi:hypothetical protein EA462_09745 [Natrarchaeobius halalkaliphilus]|uniref:Intracellular proteinase inhibitor BsuPI domain-containing protein n=1 Tax=Natrarchaeobius halalkaliphilus TaxID=1679091 RepID=A0A3N6LME3_9EURY|nr:BsuPI-related putative proteinase inhibitor [Natrarchaeobius halalkaliphilus]RQG90253.1 hypothetical protein EA462_09745 [Natrarchaeobius halalkaliphilus]
MTLEGTLEPTVSIGGGGTPAVEFAFSDGRAFAQVLGSERLDTDDVATYDGSWTDAQPGQYTAVAELLARETSCEARAEITVPQNG